MDPSKLSAAFGAAMDSQLFWGLVTLVLAAVAFSPKVSMNASNVLLGLAWLVGCFGIYRVELLNDWRHMLAAWLFFGCVLALIASWLQPAIPIAKITVSPTLGLNATTSAAVRPIGTVIGGIPWLSSYGDLRVGIYNGTDFDYERVDLIIMPDVAVTAAAQLTNIPGVLISLKNNPDIRMERVNPSSGERIEMQFSIIASSFGYRLECERLSSHSHIELIMAAVLMNDMKSSLEVDHVLRVNFTDGHSVWSARRDHTEKIFGNKPVPSLVKVMGRYVAQQKEYVVSESIIVKDFTLEAIQAIPKPLENAGKK